MHAQTPTEEYVPQPPTGHAPTDSRCPSKKCAAKTRALSPEVPAHAKPTGCVPIVPIRCSLRTQRTAPPHPLLGRVITAHRAHGNRANGAPQAKNRRHPSTPPVPNWQQARRLPHEYRSQWAPTPGAPSNRRDTGYVVYHSNSTEHKHPPVPDVSARTQAYRGSSDREQPPRHHGHSQPPSPRQ